MNFNNVGSIKKASLKAGGNVNNVTVEKGTVNLNSGPDVSRRAHEREQNVSVQELDDELKWLKRFRSEQPDLREYKLEKKARVLIIQNVFDESLRHEERKFTVGDQQKLRDLFQNHLNCHVECKTKVTSLELPQVLADFKAACTVDDNGSCFIVLMSHGDLGRILMEDEKLVDLYLDIVYQFNSKNFPEFIDKPKIFLVQACQGIHLDEKLQARESSDSVSEPRARERGITDALVYLATCPYQPALTVEGTGALFIHFICQVFRKKAADSTLQEMIDQVCDELDKDADQNVRSYIQIPSYSVHKFKKYKFYMKDK